MKTETKTFRALAIVGYGKNGKIKQLSELRETTNPYFAICPMGTKFNKDILKEYRGKVVEIEIKLIK